MEQEFKFSSNIIHFFRLKTFTCSLHFRDCAMVRHNVNANDKNNFLNVFQIPRDQTEIEMFLNCVVACTKVTNISVHWAVQKPFPIGLDAQERQRQHSYRNRTYTYTVTFNLYCSDSKYFFYGFYPLSPIYTRIFVQCMSCSSFINGAQNIWYAPLTDRKKYCIVY